jgi:hypothetical protein
MAASELEASSKTSSYKKHDDYAVQEAEAPTFHQSFFTISTAGNDRDEDFIPELITTGKDPQNHNIEVELGSDEEHPTSKRNLTSRAERKLGLKPIHPLPIIKVDLNNNYKNWEAIFDEKETEVHGDCLKTADSVHNEPGFLPPNLRMSKKPVTFAPSQAGGLVNSQYSTVFGADINDIPTSYGIPKLAAHELAIVGTFVHGMIVPGFSYRVRLNGSSEYLFDGKALVLEAIGQGYGKHLTFESDNLLYNRNFFWSDSNPPNGFAISISLPILGEFEVKKEDEMSIGNLMVHAVGDDQIIQNMRCFQDNIQIEVGIKMSCKLALFPNKEMGTSERILGGIAIATKRGTKIQVDRIEQVSIAGYEECVLEKSK